MASPKDTAFAVNAPAKVNLYLHITGRRDDGYHTLDSLVAFGGIHDRIEAEAADDISLTVEGPFANQVPLGDDNIIIETARRLQTLLGVKGGARLTLTKRLPVAGGIGGGSADAAATIRLLIAFWDAHAPEDKLGALALDLGADVPVCLGGKAAYMGGIGEVLRETPVLPKAWMLLANPGEMLSTEAVFRRFAERHDGAWSAAAPLTTTPTTPGELAAALLGRKNDLGEAAISLVPAIGDVLDALEGLPGCLMARMSGSGATCFGLFADPDSVTQATLKLVKDRPAWWAKPASLEWDATSLKV